MAQTLRIPGGLPDVTEIGPDGTVRPTLRAARDPFARTAGDIQMAARTAPGLPRAPVLREASPAIRDVTTGLRTNPPRLNIMGANDGPRPQPLGAPNLGPELPGGMRPNAGPTPQPMGAPNVGPGLPQPTPRTTPFTPPEKPTLGWFRSALRRGGEIATGARSTAGAAVNTARAVGADAAKITAPTALGYGAAAAVNNLRQGAADSAPAFVAPAAQPGDIPTINPATGKPDAGPAVNAGSFLSQTETGRNVGNAIMAMPGVGGGLRAATEGLQALPFVERSAQVAAKAFPAAAAAVTGFVGGDANNPGVASPAAQAKAAPVQPITEGPLDTRSFPGPVGTSGPAPNAITFDPKTNSYSGSNNKYGDDIRLPDGTLRNTGDAADKTGGFGVSTVGTIGVAGYQRQLDNIRGLGTPDSTVGQGAGGIGGGRVGDTLREKTDAGRTPAGLSNRQAANFQQAEAARLQAKEISDNQIASQNQGQNQGLRIAEMNNTTSRENNANTVRANLRGQELDFERGMAPLRVAQEQRATVAALLKNSGGDPAAAMQTALAAGRVDLAETLAKPVGTMQEQAGKRDGLQKNAWDDIRTGITTLAPMPGKDGNPEASKALQEKAFARFKRSNPEGYNLQGEARQRALQTAMADEELMGVFENPQDGGFASTLPLRFDDPTRKMNDLPPATFFKGAKLGGQVGGLRGAVSPNLSKGDQILELGDGRQSINVGNLSAPALARLQALIDEGNTKAGK